MPNIHIDYVKYMKDKITDDSFGCTTKFGDWIEPFSSFYSVDLIGAIEDYLRSNRRSINGLIDQLKFSYIEEDEARRFSPNWDMFLNLNTKNDLESYLESLVWCE